MLLQRVLTALVLLPVVLGLVWFAPLGGLYVAFMLIGGLAAHEWTGLMLLKSAPLRWAYVAVNLALLGLAWVDRAAWPWFAAAEVLWWLVALALMPGFPDNFQRHPPAQAVLAILGPLLWVPAILCLTMLRNMPNGAERLAFTLMLIWAADVGAYLAGRNLGRHKLAPRVSPGKTREGALGGLLLGALWATFAGAYVFEVDSWGPLLKVVGLSVAVAALSIVGDLGISMFKRFSGIKDSGNLLPGHGGILDRVDSLLAAGPAMALGLYWLKV